MSSGFTLYRLYSSSGELLYIDKSIHRFRRFDEHCRNQPWAAEIANASFQELADEIWLKSLGSCRSTIELRPQTIDFVLVFGSAVSISPV